MVLSGTGLWSLDGIDGADTMLPASCNPPSIRSGVSITNDGSIPGIPYVTLGGSEELCASGGHCGHGGHGGHGGHEGRNGRFGLVIETADGIVAEGPLCDLLNRRFQVAHQLDPGDSVSVWLTLTLLEPFPDDGFTIPLTLTTLFTQWNSAPPDEGGFGWTVTDDHPLDVTVNVTPSAESEPALLEASDATAQETDGPAGEDPSAGDEVSPPGEEEPLADEASPGDETSPPDDTTPPCDEPPCDEPPSEEPPADPGSAVLSGYVWNDTDADYVTVLGGPEPGLGSVEVRLLDTDGTLVASTLSNGEGFYLFTDIGPGVYVVAFVLPDGYGFSVPEETDLFETPEDLAAHLASLAEELGVPVEDLILSDVTTLDDLVGLTDPFALIAGDNHGLADAALTPPPEQPPAAGEEDGGDNSPTTDGASAVAGAPDQAGTAQAGDQAPPPVVAP